MDNQVTRGRPRTNPAMVQRRRHVALDDEIWERARLIGGGTPGKNDGSRAEGIRRALRSVDIPE